MSDARRGPEISPASVFLALLRAFVFRLPSFQQMDSEGSGARFTRIGIYAPPREERKRVVKPGTL
jgi:hypothetical protein